MCGYLGYLLEAEKDLKISRVYQDVQFQEKLLFDVVVKDNNMFRKLEQRPVLSRKELKHFTY